MLSINQATQVLHIGKPRLYRLMKKCEISPIPDGHRKILTEDQIEILKEVIEKEIEIAKEQLRSEGKPENMLENIAKGKLKKFFKENTLINQAYIKDTKISVINYLHSVNQNCSISDFKRISLV